jgi:hypothetical protein
MAIFRRDKGVCQVCLHHRLEAVHNDARQRCHRHARTGVGGFRSRPCEVVYKPLLSDNGSSDISSDLAEWLKDRGMVNIRGAPCHPQTQGKIEHQDLVPLLVAGVPPETRLPAAIRACWARLFREAVSYQSDPERDGHVWVGILLNTVHFLRYYADSRGTKEAGNGSKTTSA